MDPRMPGPTARIFGAAVGKWNGRRRFAGEFVTMLTLNRVSKLTLLFFSPANPLWEELVENEPKPGDPVSSRKHTITQQKVAKVADISQSTLGNWKKGGAINLEHLGKAFETVIEKVKDAKLPKERKGQLIRAIQGIQAECLDERSSTPVYDVARDQLSIQMEDCQKILDEIIYDTFTLFPSLSYDNKSAVDENWEKYRGLYHLYVRRQNLWLKSPLRVRYVVRSGIRDLIRCKLNAPKLRREPGALLPYMEYDGFLRTSEDNVYWKFEKRDAVSADFADFITDEGKLYRANGDRAVRILSGRYLTVGQDALHSIEQGDVIIEGVLPEQLAGDDYQEKLSRAEIDAVIARWMHRTAGVLDEDKTPEEWARVNQLWGKLETASRNRDAVRPLGD
jgi:hypothetical protein